MALIHTLSVTAYNLRMITTKDGLSSMSVFCLHQDAAGYMWAGTYECLNLLDGDRIKVFGAGRNGYDQISGDIIEKIHEGPAGELWIHSNHGFDKYDRNRGKVEYHPEINGSYKSTVTPAGNAIAVTGDGKWMCYDRMKGRFVKVDMQGLRFPHIKMMAADSHDNIIIATQEDTRVYTLTGEGTDKGMSLRLKSTRPNPQNMIYAGTDGDDMFIVDKWYNLYVRRKPDANCTHIYKMTPPRRFIGLVSAVVRDGADYVVGFKSEGAMRLIRDNATGTYTQEEIDIPCGVYDVCKDKNQDVLWMATDGGGIYSYRREAYDFDNYAVGDRRFKTYKQVRAIYKDDDGTLWIGTKGDGIYRIQGDGPHPAISQYTTANSGLNHDMVFNLVPGRNGIIWIGTEGDGLSYCRRGDGTIRTLRMPDMPKLRCVHYVVETDDGDMWAASNWHGIFRLKMGMRDGLPYIKSCRRYFGNSEKSGASQFFTIRRQAGRYLWFANRENGAYRLDLKTNTLIHILFVRPRQSAINDVHTINTDIPGHLLCGTSGGMLDVTITNDGTMMYRNINRRAGIGECAVRAILHTGGTSVWASTAHGLLHYDVSTGESSYHTDMSGIDIDEYCDGACFFDKTQGTAYFGSTDNIVTISSSAASATAYRPPVIFTSVSAGGRDYALSDFMRGDSVLHLRYDQTSFTLNYNAADYVNDRNYMFEYRIPEISDTWQVNKLGRTLSFNGMAPGDYTLQVRYRTGNYVSPSYEQRMVISPPWYASVWARMVYALMMAGAAALCLHVYNLRRRRRQQLMLERLEEKRKEDVYESKLGFFASITKEFAQPLMLISGSCSQILRSQYTDNHTKRYATLIKRNSTRLGALTQEITEFKRIHSERRELIAEQVDVAAEMTRIAGSFASITDIKRVECRHLPAEGTLWTTDRKALGTIVSNLVSNALKHSDADSIITISAATDDDMLTIDISFRGNGMTKQEMNDMKDHYRIIEMLENRATDTGTALGQLGLAISYGLTHLMRGSITVDEQNGRLSIMRVKIPALHADTTSAITTYLAGKTDKPKDMDITLSQRKNVPSRQTIMIVDGNTEMLWLMDDFFAAEYNVTPFHTTAEALQSMEEGHPDLVIADVGTSRNSGIDLCRHLKGDKLTRHIPVILLCDADDNGTRQTDNDAGADIYITKPFNEDDFMSVASGLLKRADTLKDYYETSLSSFELIEGRMLHKEDKALLQQMTAIINANIVSPELSTKFVADEMGLSVRSLYRSLKDITTDTPTSIIKKARLERARQLLTKTKMTMEEVCYNAGFTNRSTFYNLFTARFGCSPREYHDRQSKSVKETP